MTKYDERRGNFPDSGLTPGPDSGPNAIGLIGSITRDEIITESGAARRGLGGILYQAATLCGLKQPVILLAALAEDISVEFRRATSSWETLDTRAVIPAAGPPNQVQLTYRQGGERIEVLRSVVPPLAAESILPVLVQLKIAAVIFNSGQDITLETWQILKQAAECPLWLDIHSLALTQELNTPRRYRVLQNWREWADRIDYLQANAAEAACMLGIPGKACSDADFSRLAEAAFAGGIKAAFFTLGERGVLAMTPQASRIIPAASHLPAVDTTGCGDVFCAGTIAALTEGEDPLQAAVSGTRLAAAAAAGAGIEEIYLMAIKSRGGALPES